MPEPEREPKRSELSELVMARVAAAFFVPADRSELPDRRRATWRIGDAGRELVDRLVDTQAPDGELAVIAAEMEAIVARLRQFEHGRRYDAWAEASTIGAGAGPAVDDVTWPNGHLDFSPVVGHANPLAPPLALRVEQVDGRAVVVGDVTFGSAYEGPPGHVHGGLVAAAFDEVLGAVQALSGNAGMTGRLSVDYRAPTPLHRPLRFVARIDEVDGRKIHTSAELRAGELLCAEATGLFISVNFSHLAKFQDKRNEGRGVPADGAEAGKKKA
jgi:acyl-coenzyme A thioesterase PaaI-like protein